MFHFGTIVLFALIQFAASQSDVSRDENSRLLENIGNTLYVGKHYSLLFNPEHQLIDVVPDHEAFDGEHLNLTGETRLRTWSPGIFNFAKDAKIVDFSNTSIDKLPKDAFKDFKKLESLNLSSNKLEDLEETPFADLPTLKRLDLTNNRIQNLRPGYFFGLGNETDILISGNNVTSISTWLFEDPSFRSLKPIIDYGGLGGLGEPIYTDQVPSKVKACIREGTLEKLEVMKDDETLEAHCHEVRLDHVWREIFLNGSGIVKFAAGWYRLQDYQFRLLCLRENKIVDLSNEILGELPEYLTTVNLAGNKIERLAKGSVTNRHLKFLTLSNNSISEIEDGAFASGNLTELYLDGNHLTTTKFGASLPSGLQTLKLSRNQINELSPNAFSELQNLQMLDLSFNSIEEIRNTSFRGLLNVLNVDFSENKIRTIEPGSFRHFRKLRDLYLQKNYLSDFQAGTFDGTMTFHKIDLSFNNLTRVTKDYFPHTIDIYEMDLSYNQIEVVEAGAFSNNQHFIAHLNLEHNKISKIERGAFNIQSHNILLKNNLWSQPDGEVFKDVSFLISLALQNNGISNIEKGFAKYFVDIGKLYLSHNPIRELKNGALHGIRIHKDTEIEIADVPIELIQSGLFADV